MERIVLVAGARQHQQGSAGLLFLPQLKLLQAVRPVPAPTQQAHNNQPCLRGRLGQVVVNLRRMAQTAQGKCPDRPSQGA